MCAEECSKEGAQPSSVKVASKYVKSPRMSYISAPTLFQGTVDNLSGLMQWDLKCSSLLTGCPQSVLSMVFGTSSPFRTFQPLPLYSERKTEFFLELSHLHLPNVPLTTPLTASTSRPLAALYSVLRTFALLKCTSLQSFSDASYNLAIPSPTSAAAFLLHHLLLVLIMT